jgi:hypothetical protein
VKTASIFKVKVFPKYADSSKDFKNENRLTGIGTLYPRQGTY